MQDEFVKCLQPFIMTGKFREVIIPIKLIRSLVFIHEEKQTFSELELMIKQMDLTEYPYV